MNKYILFVALAALFTGSAALAGPTAFPDAKNEAAWAGRGPIRVHGWMVDNRNWFWTQREKDQGAVVFAGDSLTGNWKMDQMHELFPGLKIANRGIGGDVSRGLLFRFKEDVLDLHPRAIVLLIGANDLSSHGNPADAEGNIAAMIAMARAQDPKVPIVLCQTAPRDSAEAPTKPGAEADINARIAKLGAATKNLVVLNLFSVLGDASGKPVPELFAKDKLHLAPPGYVKWAGLIRPAFKQLGIEAGEPAPGAAARLTPDVGDRSVAAPSSSSKNLELRTTQDGIAIDAGSLGVFTLGYPQLIDDSQKQLHKLIEKSVAVKTATIKYADGAQVLVTISGGNVKLKFVNVPGDVKKYLMDVLIDPAFSKGGSWKIGDKAELFPRDKPANPHLFQGNANTFRFAGASGHSVSLKIPDYAYQELNDNREWGWTIFGWKFIANFDAHNPEAIIVIAGDAPAAAKKLIDAFGQSIAEDFPGKVKSVEELKADVAAEKAYFDSLNPPQRDRFGGLVMNLALKKTGFFHVEMDDDGKQWLVDPDGNAFFHFGICVFNPGDDYTYIKGREDIYEWLPSAGGEFKTAFRERSDEGFSFHLANMIKKYGQPYTNEDYTRRMIERVRNWGFNSVGAFGGIPDSVTKAENFPHVAHLPLSEWDGIPRVPGVFESFDPFDEATRAKIGENFAKHVPPRANDPLLIGYFVVNEPRFDEIPRSIPALDGKHACKRKLVSMLSGKYKNIGAYNAAWDVQAKSFEELNDAGLAVKTDAARKDMTDYTGLFLDAYFSIVNESFRKHDPNHMLIGARYQPQTINDEQLCRITGTYCEVMSFNYYTHAVDRQLLKNVYEWSGQRPMILSEFFWSSPRDSGLAGGRDVKSQRERGLAYRNYVEQSASLGFVIGIEWFTLVDQSATGRWFSKYNGESANTGLFAVSDRPWKDAAAEMMKTNYEIYDVLLRKRAPFAFDDPRFR